MDDASREGGDSGRERIIRRACDQCRIRKIGCDRDLPCSNCRNVRLECTHSSTAGGKLKEVKQRVLISSQYEKKIDEIADSLKRIELSLQHSQQSTSIAVPASTWKPPQALSTPCSTIPSTTPSELRDVPHHIFEGESSLTAHSVHANDILERAVHTSSSEELRRQLSDTFAALRLAVETQNLSSTLPAVALPHAKLQDHWRSCQMPPTEVTVTVLRWAKETPPGAVLFLSDFLPIDKFFEICQKVCFPIFEYYEAEFILANASLYWFSIDYCATIEDDGVRSTYFKYAMVFQTNIQTALSHISLAQAPTLEIIAALAIGAYYTVEISKPVLAGLFTAAASQLCQTLGYHRLSSMKNDDSDTKALKMRLFWSIYIMDRSLSLRLGRAPTIPDYDISLPETLSNSQLIRTARIQGKVYEKLYSPFALSEPSNERAAHAQQLAIDIKRVLEETTEAETWEQSPFLVTPNERMVNAKANQVLLLSVLTLIYRAIPAAAGPQPDVSADCIAAARTALEEHQKCIEMIPSDNVSILIMHLNWTILYTPFVPFIVIICHIIETRDQTDIDRLRAFITSLQPACSTCESIAKLHRLFDLLFTVVQLYVDFQGLRQSSDHKQHINDPNISSGGSGPGPVESSSHMETESVDRSLGQEPWVVETGNVPFGLEHAMNDDFIIQGSQLEDWFYSSQFNVGLSEDL